MSLIDLCDQLATAATARRDRNANSRAVEDFKNLEQATRDAHNELFPCWSGLRVLRDQGMISDVESALPAQIEREATAAIQLLDSGGNDIINSQKFPLNPFIRQATTLTGQAEKQLGDAWARYYDANVPAITSDVLQLFRVLAGAGGAKQQTLRDLSNRTSKVAGWRDKWPRDANEFAKFRDALTELRSALTMLLEAKDDTLMQVLLKIAQGNFRFADANEKIHGELDRIGASQHLVVTFRAAGTS